MFARRLVLLATPRQVGVLDYRPGRLHWLGEYAATPEGLAAFRDVVSRHAKQPVVVVVDTVDEDYRSEILPHVQGHARDAMLARKLRQVFRNVRFNGGCRQARETSGRRDDRYLLAALNDAEWLTPWLGVLQAERAPLAGVTPMAVACQHLLARLRIQEPHTLLACRLGNGLRLSYYQNGCLRFSRLIAGDTPTQQPGSAADEIAKTQLYLTGQRILPREARLHVLLLDPGNQLASAQAALNADPSFSTRQIDVTSLARALRIPDEFLAATPEIAPLAAIAGESLTLNMAPPELLQRHHEFRWQRSLNAVAGAIALGGLVATGAYWLHAQDLNGRARALALKSQQLDARYRVVALTFPSQVPDPEALAQTVALARQLEDQPAHAAALMGAVGRALSASPDIKLEHLGWTDPTLAPPRGIAVTLDAAVSPFDGNFRAAMRHIERFMQTLRAVPALHDVRLRAGPVNADSAATLAGKTRNDGALGAPDARFALDLEYREDAR
jgi:hypothetical protein